MSNTVNKIAQKAILEMDKKSKQPIKVVSMGDSCNNAMLNNPSDEDKSFLSGGLIGAAKITGKGYIYWMMIRHALSYIRTMWFFLKKGELKMLRNFLYTKVFVPVGEAAGSVYYIFFGNR